MLALAALLAAASMVVGGSRASTRWSVPTWRLSWRRPLRSGARRAAELEWVEAVAAELRAGGDPLTCLVSTGSSCDVVPEARAMARRGGDVVSALRRDGAGSDLLRGVAACWEVAAGTGAGLAAALLALADSARETERVRRELQAGVAEPKATAVVLAGLPVVGMAMGAALGAEPLHWLLGSPLGLLVLACGVAFEVAGALWAWHIAASLESRL